MALEGIGPCVSDRLRKRDMHEFRRELQVKHLRGKMLAACIMQRHASVFAACDEQVTDGRISNSTNRLIELSKVVTNTSFLDIKDTHGA